MFQNKKIGILGGGQLGKMLIQSGSRWGLDFHVLDKSIDFPAGQICSQFIEGDFQNYDDVVQFGKQMDVITIEIEAINVDALEMLQSSGVEVFPQPALIRMIQDKGLQKEFYKKNGYPSSKFEFAKNKKELALHFENSKNKFPKVIKLRKGGYDGKGVQIVRDQKDLESIFDAPCVIEDMVEIEKEISVIVSRNSLGEVRTFPVVEMVFNHEANLLDHQLCPTTIAGATEHKALELAEDIANKTNLIGLLAIEMFVTKDGSLLINEMAPRPHNSGHHTIESNHTSQYEQLLRSILHMPLGDTALKEKSILYNLLGEAGHQGEVYYQNLNKIMEVENVYLHIYGKKMTKPYRKMGHINFVGDTMKELQEKLQFIKKTFKVTSKG